MIMIFLMKNYHYDEANHPVRDRPFDPVRAIVPSVLHLNRPVFLLRFLQEKKRPKIMVYKLVY